MKKTYFVYIRFYRNGQRDRGQPVYNGVKWFVWQQVNTPRRINKTHITTSYL